ncbi:hypothetical protein KC207_13750 [Phycicoccus sp. BSK3Z-2]|uniref:Uncharacterized protein n=1 Tax=Phycicoccus avicenniae TaxID=2828860 RepID=A0A941HZQ6_9MICO|nr:hypothetical protein [Phycicoccus avicenniae]MBR7744353.1 hypothetical protein [Phycicoccus avicenniae]
MRDLHAVPGVFASRPLPYPIYAASGSPSRDQQTRDSHVAVLVHTVIGRVADTCLGAPVADAVAAVLAATEDVVPPGRGAVKTRMLVAGHASKYVTRFLPSAGATFLGAEVPVVRGRVDLAWSHPDCGVWFDEIKVWRHARTVWDWRTYDQIERYLSAGSAMFGDAFTGVRLVVTGHTYDCVLVDPGGEVIPLAESVLAPTALTLGGAA